ncbi:glucose-fructose oxidoreductase [Salinarchaeum sp. Harcht-Bsk1]|uniref:D-xylose 1-dehydrogenase Gfo6 n=1 Tax=Salinarchaeum sp. Harcht-Bsk1 TaxID=1333523 RepID=UPI00034241CF|nr:D-xylose 1-dehydrogenase Gfo6 [Salinarchaeum sp. Harcht-Bsk1]AGN01549.1 glucose-fructose oxidoreductase [Salinarchaeum sp. Harcht-Bsk1]
MDIADLADDFTARDWQRTEPDPDDPLRFAMIGLGWWTVEEMLPAVAAEPGIETTVLVSSTAEKAERVASETHTDAVGIDYDAFHDGAAAEEYDAAYVCTPNALHLPYVETASELDKAVLCEKPLESTAERAERLVAAAEGIPIMTAYRMHTDPAIRVAKRLYEEGAIGDPVAVQGHMTQDVLYIAGADSWRLNPDLAGPGASVTDLGIYPINTARFVLDREPVAAQATMTSSHEAFEDVPDEVANFLIEYEGDVTGSYTASQHAQLSGSLRIIGTEGELRLEPAFFNDDRARLHYRTGEAGISEQTITFPTVDQMQVEAAYFADCLRDGREIEADAAHGLVDMRAIEAVYEAAERGERVAV